MASTSPKNDSRAVACDEVATEESEQKVMAVGSKTPSSPVTSGSPAKPVQTSPVAKSDSPLKPVVGSPVADPVDGSSHQNGDHVTDTSNENENGTGQSLGSEDTMPADTSDKNNVEKGQTVGAVEGSESGDKPERAGSEAGVETEQPDEGRVEKDARGEGRTAECGENGLVGVDGSSEKATTEDVERKVEQMKLDVNPKVQSPTKTSCAAI